jgi:hypothetical protein
MNGTTVHGPRGGFEDRLEAELVKVVTQRAAALPAAQRRPVVRRLPVRVGLVAGTAAAAAAAAAVVVAALGPSAGAPRVVTHNVGAGSAPVRTAAFTLARYTDGTIHVTWDKQQYFQDHAGLEQALRAAGFPVQIKDGVFCKGPHDTASPGSTGVGPGVTRVMKGVRQADGKVTFVFTPSAMPPGEELFIDYLSPSQLAVTQGQPGSIEWLVPASGPLTCTTQLPALPPGSSQHAGSGQQAPASPKK